MDVEELENVFISLFSAWICLVKLEVLVQLRSLEKSSGVIATSRAERASEEEDMESWQFDRNYQYITARLQHCSRSENCRGPFLLVTDVNCAH